jgi:hypothetical protein
VASASMSRLSRENVGASTSHSPWAFTACYRYSFTLKIRAADFSEILAHFHQVAVCHISENNNHEHLCHSSFWTFYHCSVHSSCGGGLEYLHHSPASCRRQWKGNSVPCGITVPTLSLVDVNTETWSFRLWFRCNANNLIL